MQAIYMKVTEMINPDERNWLVVYAQHLLSLEDPLNSGQYNDTAQKQYDDYFHSITRTKEQWIADNFSVISPLPGYQAAENVPIPVMSLLLFGRKHMINIHHVGLNTTTNTITPYIVPTLLHHNGYYVGKTPLTASGILGNNEHGYAGYWEDTYGTNSGQYRHRVLLDLIVHSQYFTDNLPLNLFFNKNLSTTIDMIILVIPQMYKFGYYLNDDNNTVQSLLLGTTGYSGSIVLNSGSAYQQNISKIYFQPYASSRTILHEYIHAAAGKASAGTLTPYLLGGTQKTNYTVPDIYCFNNAAFGPNPPAPYGMYPMSGGDFMAEAKTIFQLNGITAAKYGFTTLDNVITSSGTYAIKNRVDSNDYLCIRSPHDSTSYCILHAYYPKPLSGSYSYPGAETGSRGVIATVVRMKPLSLNTYYQNDNSFRPITSYAITNMTAQYGYAPINNELYIGTSSVLNRKCVRLLYTAYTGSVPTTHGLLNMLPFGITVLWEGWTDVPAIPTAHVKITFN